MANIAHHRILKKGVKEWNKWGEDNPDINPDLRGIDFSGEKLHGINLDYAKLYRANFSGSDLSGSKLRYASITNANFSNTVFSRATLKYSRIFSSTLIGANFTHASLEFARVNDSNLTGAILVDCNLKFTDLTNADLTGSNLAEARLMNTVFTDTMLFNVSGLIECQHLGDSVIGKGTLALSDDLPISFLKNAGLGDELIKALTGRDIVSIELTEEEYNLLLPFERLIIQELGDKFVIEKGKSSVTIVLESAEDIKIVLTVLLPALAAIEAERNGTVKSIKVKTRDGSVEEVQQPDIPNFLKQVEGMIKNTVKEALDENKRDNIKTAEDKNLDFFPETVVRIGEGAPIFGPTVGYWLRSFFEIGPDQLTKNIYWGFRQIFIGVEMLGDKLQKKSNLKMIEANDPKPESPKTED